MDILDFLKQLDSQPPGPVTLLCPFKAPRARAATFEPLLADRAVDKIVKRHVDPATKDMAYASYFADEADVREIISNAETLPFLAERRVIVIRRAEQYVSEKAAGGLLDYLTNPCESTLLIMVAETIDKRSKFYKACVKAGDVITCPEMNETQVTKWIVEQTAKRGKRITHAAIREIITRTGTRLGDVNNAINVVCGYSADKEEITEEAVRASCADVAEEQVWALTDAIAASDTNAAIAALRELLDMGVNEFQLMGSINWLLKSAHAVANRTPSLSRMNKFVANKVRPLADKLGPAKIKAAFALCMDTEILLRSTHVDRSLAMELLVVKLAAPTKRRAASTR